MTDIDFDQAVEDFWQARQGGPFPVQWQDSFDRDTAYRICLAMIARHEASGDPQAGWKVGLTAKAIREQQGAPSRCSRSSMPTAAGQAAFPTLTPI
jgi:2-keto-4-pentenoate hydratase